MRTKSKWEDFANVCGGTELLLFLLGLSADSREGYKFGGLVMMLVAGGINLR